MLYLLYGFAPVTNIEKTLEALWLKGGEYWPRAKPESFKAFSILMYSSTQQKQVRKRLTFYDGQASKLLRVKADLALAYRIAQQYSYEDAQFYLQMIYWIQARYQYVIENTLSYIPPRS